MINQTLRDIVLQKNAPGSPIMNHLKKSPGIIKTAFATFANDGLKHNHKKLIALPSFTAGDLGGTVTPTGQKSEFVTAGLTYLQALESEPQAVLDNMIGGAGAYFAGSALGYEESFLQDTTKGFIYGSDGTFGAGTNGKGFHQIAKEYGNVIQRGGSTGGNSSIFAVKWDRDTCSTLYNGDVIGTGRFMVTQPLHGKQAVPVVHNVTTGESRIDYQMLHKGYSGLFSGSSFDIAAMTQIDGSHLPTAILLQELIDMVNGTAENTFLYMTSRTKRYIETLSDAKYERGNMDKDYNILLSYFNTIPIVVDGNISNVETNVLD